jgi:hypothetical protein
MGQDRPGVLLVASMVNLSETFQRLERMEIRTNKNNVNYVREQNLRHALQMK